jgi:hypothetical protein
MIEGIYLITPPLFAKAKQVFENCIELYKCMRGLKNTQRVHRYLEDAEQDPQRNVELARISKVQELLRMAGSDFTSRVADVLKQIDDAQAQLILQQNTSRDFITNFDKSATLSDAERLYYLHHLSLIEIIPEVAKALDSKRARVLTWSTQGLPARYQDECATFTSQNMRSSGTATALGLSVALGATVGVAHALMKSFSSLESVVTSANYWAQLVSNLPAEVASSDAALAVLGTVAAAGVGCAAHQFYKWYRAEEKPLLVIRGNELDLEATQNNLIDAFTTCLAKVNTVSTWVDNTANIVQTSTLVLNAQIAKESIGTAVKAYSPPDEEKVTNGRWWGRTQKAFSQLPALSRYRMSLTPEASLAEWGKSVSCDEINKAYPGVGLSSSRERMCNAQKMKGSDIQMCSFAESEDVDKSSNIQVGQCYDTNAYNRATTYASDADAWAKQYSTYRYFKNDAKTMKDAPTKSLLDGSVLSDDDVDKLRAIYTRMIKYEKARVTFRLSKKEFDLFKRLVPENHYTPVETRFPDKYDKGRQGKVSRAWDALKESVEHFSMGPENVLTPSGAGEEKSIDWAATWAAMQQGFGTEEALLPPPEERGGTREDLEGIAEAIKEGFGIEEALAPQTEEQGVPAAEEVYAYLLWQKTKSSSIAALQAIGELENYLGLTAVDIVAAAMTAAKKRGVSAMSAITRKNIAVELGAMEEGMGMEDVLGGNPDVPSPSEPSAATERQMKSWLRRFFAPKPKPVVIPRDATATAAATAAAAATVDPQEEARRKKQRERDLRIAFGFPPS